VTGTVVRPVASLERVAVVIQRLAGESQYCTRTERFMDALAGDAFTFTMALLPAMTGNGVVDHPLSELDSPTTALIVLDPVVTAVATAVA
jgi:hypothetical protein